MDRTHGASSMRCEPRAQVASQGVHGSSSRTARRTSLRSGSKSRYRVTCTLLTKGLIYVTMMAGTRVTARVAKVRRKNVVRQPAVTNENAAHPISSAWRPTLRKIVKALARDDYALQTSRVAERSVTHAENKKAAHLCTASSFSWWRRGGSNPRPLECDPRRPE